MSYLLLIAVVYFLHLLLKMNWICTGILFLYGIWSLSRHKKVLRGQKFQEERFFAVSLYLDTVLYAFLKEEKIDGALRDTAAEAERFGIRRDRAVNYHCDWKKPFLANE